MDGGNFGNQVEQMQHKLSYTFILFRHRHCPPLLQKMRAILMFTALAAASPCRPANGCSTHHDTNKVTNVSITSNGLDRSYLIWVPNSYKPGTQSSVILSYHGGTKTAEDQLQLDKLTDPFFKTSSIVVYPQGINVRPPSP